MPKTEPGAIQRWSTDDVPQADRLEYFAAALSEATEVPVGVACPNPRSFHAQVSYAHLSTIGVSKVMGSPHRAFRGPSELSRTGDHRFNLMMGLTSSWSANHRGPLRLSPRDVLIHDSQFPVDITAADVARSLNISLRTLHRTLAAAHEVFGTRLIDARVRVAQRMLASPQFNRLTTAEIGVRAGFLSASHFARALRKRTGRTPLQLRRGG